ncbi:unnamed protein product [Gordionus sp. m RMFG-2023]|uniref:zinc finger CCCH domain-containing protein 18-like isoform X2 n=1 Tax=Gordionus sp. m RMFG-2023 TaxID=3053472 RepID=UPI0030E28C1A
METFSNQEHLSSIDRISLNEEGEILSDNEEVDEKLFINTSNNSILSESNDNLIVPFGKFEDDSLEVDHNHSKDKNPENKQNDSIKTKVLIDLEEGELSDDPNIGNTNISSIDQKIKISYHNNSSQNLTSTNKIMCRFYIRGGNCNWGMACRFLHPGMNDGSRSRFSTPQVKDPIVQMKSLHPLEDKKITESTNNLILSNSSLANDINSKIHKESPKESAWERGLRQAKQLMKRNIPQVTLPSCPSPNQLATPRDFTPPPSAVSSAPLNKSNGEQIVLPRNDNLSVTVTLEGVGPSPRFGSRGIRHPPPTYYSHPPPRAHHPRGYPPPHSMPHPPRMRPYLGGRGPPPHPYGPPPPHMHPLHHPPLHPAGPPRIRSHPPPIHHYDYGESMEPSYYPPDLQMVEEPPHPGYRYPPPPAYPPPSRYKYPTYHAPPQAGDYYERIDEYYEEANDVYENTDDFYDYPKAVDTQMEGVDLREALMRKHQMKRAQPVEEYERVRITQPPQYRERMYQGSESRRGLPYHSAELPYTRRTDDRDISKYRLVRRNTAKPEVPPSDYNCEKPITLHENRKEEKIRRLELAEVVPEVMVSRIVAEEDWHDPWLRRRKKHRSHSSTPSSICSKSPAPSKAINPSVIVMDKRSRGEAYEPHHHAYPSSAVRGRREHYYSRRPLPTSNRLASAVDENYYERKFRRTRKLMSSTSPRPVLRVTEDNFIKPEMGMKARDDDVMPIDDLKIPSDEKKGEKRKKKIAKGKSSVSRSSTGSEGSSSSSSGSSSSSSGSSGSCSSASRISANKLSKINESNKKILTEPEQITIFEPEKKDSRSSTPSSSSTYRHYKRINKESKFQNSKENKQGIIHDMHSLKNTQDFLPEQPLKQRSNSFSSISSFESYEKIEKNSIKVEKKENVYVEKLLRPVKIESTSHPKTSMPTQQIKMKLVSKSKDIKGLSDKHLVHRANREVFSPLSSSSSNDDHDSYKHKNNDSQTKKFITEQPVTTNKLKLQQHKHLPPSKQKEYITYDKMSTVYPTLSNTSKGSSSTSSQQLQAVNRREELLKQLKAVEEAIARKRTK